MSKGRAILEKCEFCMNRKSVCTLIAENGIKDEADICIPCQKKIDKGETITDIYGFEWWRDREGRCLIG